MNARECAAYERLQPGGMTARYKLALRCNDCGADYEGPWRIDDAEHSAWKSGWLRLGRYADDRHRCPNCVSRIAGETYAEQLRRGKRDRVRGVG